jgi:hypothetical protein
MVNVHRGWIIGLASPLALFTALTPRVCAATPPVEEPPSAPSTTRASPSRETWRWYGWQTFAADSVAGALFLGAYADHHNTALYALSGVTFGLGAPAIHVAHGRWAIAVGSFGLRILGPVVGGVIGAGADVRHSENNGGDDSHGKWAALGAGIGGLVVSAIDGVLLAHDPELSPLPPRAQSLLSHSLPEVVLLRQGVALGYSGQF